MVKEFETKIKCHACKTTLGFVGTTMLANLKMCCTKCSVNSNEDN